MDDKARVRTIIRRLAKAHPDAACALHFSNPLDLLVATILSAQCTDARVNVVTEGLFAKYRSAEDYAKAPQAELERDVKTCGFFRMKAKAIREACAALLEKHGGQVPPDIDALTQLPGVGRKTANVVLGNVFGQPAIMVDTHVLRLSTRLGLTRQTDRDQVEQDLMAVVPKKDWTRFSHLLIFHGRRVCRARRPDHAHCVIRDLCPSRDI
jgi:endonuclease-3